MVNCLDCLVKVSLFLCLGWLWCTTLTCQLCFRSITNLCKKRVEKDSVFSDANNIRIRLAIQCAKAGPKKSSRVHRLKTQPRGERVALRRKQECPEYMKQCKRRFCCFCQSNMQIYIY